MRSSTTLTLAWRGLKGRRQRVVLVIACLCLGVMARVAVGSAIADTSLTVERQARTLVGADLIFSADQPLSDAQRQDLADILPAAARQTRLRTTVTMAARGDGAGARLVLLRAVDPQWPLRGQVVVESDGQTQRWDAAALASALSDHSVLVQRDLLVQLSMAVGDELQIGEQRYRIQGVLVDEPGGGSVMMTIGPTVLMKQASLDESGLTGFASRVTHQTQVALPLAQDPQQIATQIREQWDLPTVQERGFFRQIRPGSEIRLVTASESLAAVERFLQRFGDFLRLLALLALLLGAVGVAHLVRGFVMTTLPDQALMSVLGARPLRLVRIMLVQVLILGAAGGVVGALLGAGFHALSVAFLGHLVDLELRGLPHLPSMFWGLGLGLGAAVIAGLPPVLALRHLHPLPILRGEAARLPADRAVAWLVLVAGVAVAVVVAAVETRSWQLGPAMVGGAVLVAFLIAGLASIILPILSRLPVGRAGLRHGLANLGRPGFRPTAAVVALGVAACTLGVLASYRSSLSGALVNSLSNRAPAIYAIEIPDHEVERFQEVATAAGAANVETAPMVTARLRAINGQAINAENLGSGREAERRLWALTREQRLSWREQLGPDEVITAGRWMAADSSGEVSVASTFAEAAGLAVGDTLTVDIQGVQLAVEVTSIREVDWLGFRLNFFMLMSPQTLKPAPRQWLATMAVTPGDQAEMSRLQIQAALAREFPMVTTIDVAQQVDKARAVFSRMALAVVALSVIALLAGLAVLIGICAASAQERRQDAALLRVCGASNGDLRAAVIAEFAISGLLAAILGVGLSLLAAWGILGGMLDLPLTIPAIELLLLTVGMVVAVVITGLVATHSTRRSSPLAVLREE